MDNRSDDKTKRVTPKNSDAYKKAFEQLATMLALRVPRNKFVTACCESFGVSNMTAYRWYDRANNDVKTMNFFDTKEELQKNYLLLQNLMNRNLAIKDYPEVRKIAKEILEVTQALRIEQLRGKKISDLKLEQLSNEALAELLLSGNQYATVFVQKAYIGKVEASDQDKNKEESLTINIGNQAILDAIKKK